MKTGLLFLIFAVIGYVTPAQEVLSSGGNSHSQNNINISYTIGEPIIETYIGENNIITQGFHQTKLVVTAIDIVERQPFIINVYPNPAHNSVEISIDSETDKQFRFDLYDAYGKLLISQCSEEKLTHVDVKTLAPALYFLKIFESGNYAGSYKIVKQ